MLKTFFQSEQAHNLVEVSGITISIGSGNIHCDFDIRTCVERRQKIEFLKYESNFALAHAGTFSVRKLCEVISIDDYTPGIGSGQPAQKIKKRGLAAARRANDAHKLALLHAKGNPAQRRHFDSAYAVGLTHIHGFDDD